MERHEQSNSLPSRIATLVHAHFNALPKGSKPPVYPDGTRDWTPMSGIVIAKGESLKCVALTTGAKCLAASQIPRCRGLVLHDCHAEVLAIRAFNYWLLNECRNLLFQRGSSALSFSPEAKTESASNIQSVFEDVATPFIRIRKSTSSSPSSWPPFELQPDVRIYMYCTCAPCGDASMELCMAAQEDPTPWEITPTNPACNDALQMTQDNDRGSNIDSDNNNVTPSLLDGRAHFSRLGVVRRKPARADAESTRSKSCSDKLALRQVSSLLSHEASLLVAPSENAYLEGLVLPECEISRVACERSFGEAGRMGPLSGRSWPLSQTEKGEQNENNEEIHKNAIGYGYHPFKILSVPTEEVEELWPFGKPKTTTISIQQQPPPQQQHQQNTTKPPRKSKPANISVIWATAPTPTPTVQQQRQQHPQSWPFTRPENNGTKTLPKLSTSNTGLFENIVNGVKQGSRASEPLAKGASCLSRAKMWGLFYDIVQRHDIQDSSVWPLGLGMMDCGNGADASTYEGFKGVSGALVESARMRKVAIAEARGVLGGWVPNAGDERWGLEVLVDPPKKGKG